MIRERGVELQVGIEDIDTSNDVVAATYSGFRSVDEYVKNIENLLADWP